jgi:DNA (cytosine-5)-methyltransferase 1
MDRKPTIVDLFAGAGGLSLGLRNSGFDLLAAYESWDPAIATYRINIGEHIHKRFISPETEVPFADVIVGGPPCQGFSSAGPRRQEDSRNTLVGEFARLIAEVRPPAFIFENVEGFLTSGDGLFVFQLLDPLIEAGYRIHLRKINAVNYGVPQHRKRVIAIGGLGWDPSFPEPTHLAYGAPGAHLRNKPTLCRTPSLGEALSRLPEPLSCPSTEISDHCFKPLVGDDLKRAQMLLPGQWMKDLPEELWHDSYKKRAFRRVMDGTPTERRGGAPAGIRRLKADEPSKAITGGALRDFLHPTEHRSLTIRECASLQTFPLSFQFFGSDSEKIQLIGNAVPPLLATVIGESLKKDLECPRRAILEGGRLLSFIPTLSTGMSPVLERVCRQVENRFGSFSGQRVLELA